MTMMKISLDDVEARFRASRVRSGKPVLEVVGDAATILEVIGQFVVESLEQTGQMPEQTTPEGFRLALLRFEFTGLHGRDADRPWHVLDIEQYL